MDYCIQCRRHLNGALTCAGCGTPAEELRRQAPVPSDSPVPADPGRQPGGDLDHEEFLGLSESEGQLVGRQRPGDVVPGRTGSRRAERPRGTRGRTIVIGVLGVVLAAGAVGVAQSVLGGSGGDGATTVKEETSPGDDGPRESGTGTAPGVPGPVPERTVTATATATAVGSSAPAHSAEASVTPSEKALVSPSAAPHTEQATAPGSPEPSGPDDPASPSVLPSGPTGVPASPSATSAAPTPGPEPSETCKHILWWCR